MHGNPPRWKPNRLVGASIGLCVTLCCITSCRKPVDPEVSAKFQSAQTAFDQATDPGDFLRAAAIYQEVRNAGVVSGAVLYNQGNAYMRAGERGRAVACYRMAQRYRPRDSFLDANLRFALGNSHTVRRKPLIEHVLFWQDWVSYPAKFNLSWLSAVITFAVATTSLLTRVRLLKRIAMLSLGVTLALALSASYDWYRFEHLQHGVIIEDDVIARKGDSERYQPAFTQPLAEGVEFRVLRQRNGWIFVRIRDGQEGWVPAGLAVVY